MVLNRRGTLRQGSVNKFTGSGMPYALCKMENFINEFTNKYICFYSLFDVRVA